MLQHNTPGWTYSILSVGSVTVVSLSQHDGLGNLVTLVLVDVTKNISQSGVCLFVRVGDTHTTTGRNVVSDEVALGVDNGDESNIVGEDIDGIVWWDSDGHLEFTWQVGWAVEWLKVLDGITCDLLFVEPDLVVGVGGGKQVL